MTPSARNMPRHAVRVAKQATFRGALSLSRLRHRLAGDAAVALTFDDGPDPEHTPAILDELRRLDVRATFFLVGQCARARPDLVRRILEDGHAVGSHSLSHPDPWRLSLRRLVTEYRGGRVQLEAAAGRRVALFRPPKGYVDTTGAMAMTAARVRPWLWTIDSRDWVPGVTSDEIVTAVMGLGAGDVILLHDAIQQPLAPPALDRRATRDALADIVAIGRQRQLEWTTLS
jgi:peptidoglycan-N-acetylglucosamine deacetylase